MKKSCHGRHNKGDAKRTLSLAIIRYSYPPLVCYAQGIEMESNSDEKNPANASVHAIIHATKKYIHTIIKLLVSL